MAMLTDMTANECIRELQSTSKSPDSRLGGGKKLAPKGLDVSKSELYYVKKLNSLHMYKQKTRVINPNQDGMLSRKQSSGTPAITAKNWETSMNSCDLLKNNFDANNMSSEANLRKSLYNTAHGRIMIQKK